MELHLRLPEVLVARGFQAVLLVHLFKEQVVAVLVVEVEMVMLVKMLQQTLVAVVEDVVLEMQAKLAVEMAALEL